jgi:cell division septation protein DedD
LPPRIRASRAVVVALLWTFVVFEGQADAAPGLSIQNGGDDPKLQQTRPRRVHDQPPDRPTNRAEKPGKSRTMRKKTSTTRGAKNENRADSSYAVQLGAFLQAGNAERLAAQANEKGYKAEVMVLKDSRGRSWHLVRVGAYPDQGQAHTIASEIEGKLKIKIVVRPSKSM